jgi:nitric oxide reductase subunit B
MEYRDIRKEGMAFSYKWPMYFLVAASFWNFLGAGIFGFLINLPIINFYEHGTYLTMHHAHTAMFGTYGMLSVALLLFSWRGLVDKAHWKDGILKLSFWGLNGGLFLLAFGTLLPIGAMQAWASFTDGLWVARSADFFEKGSVVLLGTLRVIPDVIIIVLGVLPLAYFLITTYPRLKAAEKTMRACGSGWGLNCNHNDSRLTAKNQKARFDLNRAFYLSPINLFWQISVYHFK